jgi:glutathione S-transferase
LTKRPEWFNAQVNPTGTVPVLQIDENTFIPESIIISEYLDSYYKDNKLTPTCSLENAKQKLVVETFNRVIVSFYKFYRKTEPDADKLLISALEDTVEKKLTGNYFGGKILFYLKKILLNDLTINIL